MQYLEFLTAPVLILATTMLTLFVGYKYQQGNQKSFADVKSELKNDMSDLKSELKNDMSDLKSELKNDMSDLKSELKNDMSDLKSELKEDISVVKKDVSDVSGNFKALLGYLRGKFGEKLTDVPFSDTRTGIAATGPEVAKAASPIVLTSKGLEGAHRMGAEEIAKKYQHHIIVPDDANKLVIQQKCFDFIDSGDFLNLVNQKEKDIIQNEIYESSKKATETLLIFGILFRDIILKSRGLPVPVSSEETESPS